MLCMCKKGAVEQVFYLEFLRSPNFFNSLWGGGKLAFQCKRRAKSKDNFITARVLTVCLITERISSLVILTFINLLLTDC